MMVYDLSDDSNPLNHASVYFSEVSYVANGDCGPRTQPDYQIVTVYEGDARIRLDGQWHDLPAGWMALLTPGHEEYFQFALRGHTRHGWMSLGLPKRDIKLTRFEGLPFKVPLTDRMRQLMTMGMSLRLGSTPCDGPVILSLGLTVLEEYRAESQRRPDPIPMPDGVLRALRFMDMNFHEPMDMEDISEASAVSRNHLIRLFKEHLGETPIRYLWKLRVRRGGDLLRQTDLQMGQIAEMVGFASPYHFSRLIKQHYGQTAREIRAAARVRNQQGLETG